MMPQIEMSGGIRVVFEYAVQFLNLGHEVTLIYPSLTKPPLKFSARGVRAWKKFLYLQAKRYRHLGLEEVRFYGIGDHLLETPNPRAADQIPDGDIILATSWETAYWVAAQPSSKGDKWYLIQSYEAWDSEKPENVDATWKLPLKKIAIASWLKELGETKFGEHLFGPVINGVNTHLFKPPEDEKKFSGRVGLMHSPWEFKGTADGLAAFESAKRKIPNLSLVMFGKTTGRPADIPPYAEYHSRPSQRKLAELYRTFDIFLFPSKFEGCPLPPMEAMASQVPVVSTDIVGIKDYMTHNKTALIAPAGQPEQLAQHLIALSTDRKLRERLALKGLNNIRQFTWANAAEEMLQLFQVSKVSEKV